MTERHLQADGNAPEARRRLSFANAMSSLALFVALGGTSYAALTISGKNVKNESLTTADVRNGSLTTSDVKNGSLLLEDFRSGQVPAGAQGPSGAPGAPGPKGESGAPGTKGDPGPGSSAAGASATTPVVLTVESEWQTLVTRQVTSAHSGRLLVSGTTEETAKGGGAQIEYRIVHNGHDHPVPSSHTLAANADDQGVVSFDCNLFPGAQDVALQARTTAGAAEIGSRTITVELANAAAG